MLISFRFTCAMTDAQVQAVYENITAFYSGIGSQENQKILNEFSSSVSAPFLLKVAVKQEFRPLSTKDISGGSVDGM